MTDLNRIIEAASVLKSLTEGTCDGGHSKLIGKKCIVRTYSEGVIFGEIEDARSDYVRIKNARKLWRWKAKQSVALEAVAKYGIDQSGSRITPTVDIKEIFERYSITTCTDEAIKSIETAPETEQS